MYLDSGKNINEKDENDYTILHYAVKYNSKGVILFLLKNNCDVNAMTKLNETALHFSVIEQNKNVVLLLLKCIS